MEPGASRCGPLGHCVPCAVAAQCARFEATPACVSGSGCHACAGDDVTHCPAERPLCATDYTCAACTESNPKACAGETPLCLVAEGRCVACLASTDCDDAAAAACVENACAPCRADDDCSHLGSRSLCDTTTGRCAHCKADTDCASDQPVCDTATGDCAPCTENADCARFERTAVCADARCVECTAADDAACANAPDGPFVCRALTHSCSGLAPGSANLCDACVSDAQCQANQACAAVSFAGTALGTFCQPTTLSDCSAARPYVRQRDAVATIDGAMVTLCALRHTTCEAMDGPAGYGTPCGLDADDQPTSGNAVRGDNTRCGRTGLDDGFCVQRAPGDFRCTVPCTGDQDCPDLVGTEDPTCQSLTHELGVDALCTI